MIAGRVDFPLGRYLYAGLQQLMQAVEVYDWCNMLLLEEVDLANIEIL